MNKKIWCAGILALVVVIGAGCGQKPTTAPESGQQETTPDQQTNGSTNGSGGEATPGDTGGDEGGSNAANGNQDQGEGPTSSDTTSQTPDKAAKSQTIDVYYTDPQELDLKKAQTEISFSKDIEKYKKAFGALQSSGKSELVPLWAKVDLKTLEFKDGQITMDIHLPDEARLGAGGEQFALDALTQTMFQFDEVKSVELLVDGAKVESLMGHVDLEHPLTRH